MRATIYARVSKDRRNGTSVEQQEAEARRACEREGWTLAQVFTDNGRSASRYAARSREAFTDLLGFLRRGGVDVLVLWESSRGSRELEEWAGLLNLCRRNKIRIHVITHGRTYDLSVSRDWRNLAEDGVDSEYESEKTRSRILRNVRANAEQGRPHGRIPYGYSREYDQSTGLYVTQVIRDDQAAVIRESAQRVANGESCYGIAQDFNNRGIPAPRGGKWDLKQISRMVTKPTYVSLRTHNGVVIGTAQWPAILDEKTFNLCVALVSNPARRTSHDLAVKHLLTGIALCGVCGGRTKLQNNRGIPSYMCIGSFHTSVKQSRLDEYVEEKVRDRIYRTDVTEIYDDHDTERRKVWKKKAKELQEQLDDALRQYLTPGPGEAKLSAAMLAKIESSLRPQLEEAQRMSQSVAVPTVVVKVLENPELWDDLSIPEKRETLRSLVKVELMPIGRGLRNYRIEDRVRLSDPRTGKVWTD